MKIVYHDYGGSHSTATAAAIHLGLISASQVPTAKILNTAVPLFDALTASDHGTLFYLGKDDSDHDVYVLPRRNQSQMVLNAVKSTIAAMEGDVDEWIFVDTLPTVNTWMRIGGYLSRRQGMIWLGRPIVTFGTRKAFPLIRDLVAQTKARVAKIQSARSQAPPMDQQSPLDSD
ncbi:MAG: DUF3189 family protein [Firmicutes bacterium]|nr:DUF3189 family protein [Bacillota bacterium]